MGIGNLGLSLLSMLALAAFTPAQGSLGVSEGLTAGGTAQVTYSDPDQAGGHVDVEVSNDMGEVQTLRIKLDANGVGTAEWDVPETGWLLASFRTPGVSLAETRPIVGGTF